MYTTYFAILSLLFFVLENPDSPTAKDGVLKDAMEGKNTLAGLAKKSLAADRCSQSLNSLFKNLPELLKNRQSSKAQVNLKRPAPSSSQAPEPQPMPPQRASTFPTQFLNRPSKLDGTHTPQSLDDNAPRSPAKPRANRRSWAKPAEPPTSSAPTPPEAMQPSTGTPAMQQHTLPIRGTPGQFNQFLPNNTPGLPDLMPIMFPSDDPFAYPTQPISTLENDHFQFDPAGSTAPFMPALPTSMDQNAATNINGFNGLPMFQGNNQSSMNAALSNQLSGSHVPSPMSHASTPGEAVNSPDLVSIPNQNFAWQGYGMNQQPNYVPADTTIQQMPTNNDPSLTMATDDNAFNAGLDLPGVPLDEIFGNSDMRNGFPNDDWATWMDIG